MTTLSTLDCAALTPEEYRTVIDYLGVETRPAAGIYLHVATQTKTGIRIMELWDRREGFEQFVQKNLGPATKATGIERQTEVTIEGLHNLFAPRLEEIPALVRARPPRVVSTLDVAGLTAVEFRAVLDYMGVEKHPERGIYLHMTTPTRDGFRIVELWDDQKGFEAFLERRLGPANKALGIERQATLTFTPLLNLFAPRLRELPGLADALPGGPKARAK